MTVVKVEKMNAEQFSAKVNEDMTVILDYLKANVVPTNTAAIALMQISVTMLSELMTDEDIHAVLHSCFDNRVGEKI